MNIFCPYYFRPQILKLLCILKTFLKLWSCPQSYLRLCPTDHISLYETTLEQYNFSQKLTILVCYEAIPLCASQLCAISTRRLCELVI
jgi:hypothetical protein